MVSGPTSGKFRGLGELWAHPRNQINWTDLQLGRPDWDGSSQLLHQTEHWHLYFSGWDPIFISKHPKTRATVFKVWLPHLGQAEIPFGGVSEEVAADLGSVGDD